MTGLAPSTYEAMLALWLGDGYPVGSLVPLGLTRLLDVDPAWTWQPYLGFLAALLALVLYELVGGVVRSPRLRALVAATASASALLYGYALWGGVKELYAAVLLALLAATASLVWKAGDGRRSCRPLPQPRSSTGSAWRERSGSSRSSPSSSSEHGAVAALPTVGLAALATLALALPALVAAPRFLDNANEVARGTDDTGNLLGPLSPWQLAGIWPSADFRVAPDESRATIVLVGVALAACALGAVLAYRRRAWRLLVLLATAVVGALVFQRLVRALDRGEGARDRLTRRSRARARRRRGARRSRGAGSRERSCSPRSSAASRGRTRSPRATRTWRRVAGSRSSRRSGSGTRATARR